MCTCPDRQHRAARSAQTGVTLVELIVALTLAAVLVGSMFGAWTLLSRGSADPLVARQSLAIAQSLLREIELQPLPGTAVTGGTAGRTGYASISDYDGLAMSGIRDVEGSTVPGLEGYDARVAVSPQALAGVPATDGWWVTVNVTGPGGQTMALASWRARR